MQKFEFFLHIPAIAISAAAHGCEITIYFSYVTDINVLYNK